MCTVAARRAGWALSLLALLIALGACSERRSPVTPPEVATLERPAPAPTGEYTLVVREDARDGQRFQTFEIRNAADQVVFAPDEQFTARDTNFFLWDVAGRVWVYSGDRGTFFWVNAGAPERWERFVYAEEDVPAPPFLKEQRPRYHPK